MIPWRDRIADSERAHTTVFVILVALGLIGFRLAVVRALVTHICARVACTNSSPAIVATVGVLT